MSPARPEPTAPLARHAPIRAVRRALRVLSTVLALACLVAPGAATAWAQATPATQQGQPQAQGDEPASKAFKPLPGLDINELRRMIRIARDAGFTDQEIRDITVEDESGTEIHAWAYLKAYERHQAEEKARRKAQRDRVYLSPKEILDELNAKQPEDIDKLRDKMLFTE